MGRPASYREFWPHYVNAHRSAANRAMHVLGTSLAFGCFALALIFGAWELLLLVPVLAYGCAWFGHFLFERNRPATFKSPVYSLIADLQMYGLVLTRRMAREIQRLSAESNGPDSNRRKPD